MGTALALTSARRPHGIVDQVIGGATLTAFAVPGFWLAQIASMVLILRMRRDTAPALLT